MSYLSSSSVSEVAKPRKRIEYIDALRGATMFLVVFNHVFTISFSPDSVETVFGDMLFIFRMPLFFFISGYVGAKTVDLFDYSFLYSMTKKKIVIQLFPTVVFSFMMTLIGPYTIFDHNFLVNGWKMYWFTIALLGMFIIYYALSYILNYFKLVKYTSIIIFIVSLFLFFISRVEYFHLPKCIELHNIFHYFQFFVLGTIAKTYSSKFTSLCKNNLFSTLVISLFVFSSLLRFNSLVAESIPASMNSLWVMIRLTTPYAGLIMIFSFFMRMEGYFASNSLVSKIMQFVGRRTLDIYLLHFFFLPVLPSALADKFNFAQNVVLYIGFGSVFAIAIIALCLLVSGILRNSDFLAHYLFGAKIPDKSKA